MHNTFNTEYHRITSATNVPTLNVTPRATEKLDDPATPMTLITSLAGLIASHNGLITARESMPEGILDRAMFEINSAIGRVQLEMNYLANEHGLELGFRMNSQVYLIDVDASER